MRLHPVTWLILFAIALRLASDAALTTHDVLDVIATQKAFHHPPPIPAWPFFKGNVREVVTAISYVGAAVMVEGLSRVAAALRNSRLKQESVA